MAREFHPEDKGKYIKGIYDERTLFEGNLIKSMDSNRYFCAGYALNSYRGNLFPAIEIITIDGEPWEITTRSTPNKGCKNCRYDLSPNGCWLGHKERQDNWLKYFINTGIFAPMPCHK